jgi:hypothetical protein
VKSTNFTSKDSMASGNPLKVIKGSEVDVEFSQIEICSATKANSASPTFTGTASFTDISVSGTTTLSTINGGTY